MYISMKLLLFAALSTVLVQAVPQMNSDGRPIVDVSQGRIIGNNETMEGFNLFTYRAIPYATPPIGVLRFKAPVAAGPFSEDLDATNQPHKCPQPESPTGSPREDCLYLNVYTPTSALDVNVSEEPLAVMVFIHGGGYIWGRISDYDSVYPLTSKDVIVVTLQYRLGILGFLSTDDSAAEGNYGLMDQTLALQWVNDNIAQFGGDVNRITIFGESAGASSCSHHMITPYSSGLFRNVIMMSGTALSPWAFGTRFYNSSRRLAEIFNCTGESSSEIVECLRDVNALVLANAEELFWEWRSEPVVFGPRVDGDFIAEEPATSLRNGRYSQLPAITGMCRDEWAVQTGDMYLFKYHIDELVDNFDQNGPLSLRLHDEEDPINTATTVYDYYTGGLNFTNEASPQVNKMYTDAEVAVRHDWYIQTVGDISPTYVFSLDFDGPGSVMDDYYKSGLDLPQGEDWVAHSDDLKYVFAPTELEMYPEYHEMQEIMSTLFTDFTKYGTPTPDTSTLGFEWPTSSATALDHLSLKLNPSMAPDDRQTERTFWETLPLKVNILLHQ